jgi:tRNA_anti-like
MQVHPTTKIIKMITLKIKKLYSILLILLLLIIVGAIYGYKEYNRTAKDIKKQKPDFELNFNSMLNDFTQNDSIANAKYIGKVIAINGLLKTADKDEHGFFTLVIGDTTTSTSIRCSMDSMYNNDAIGLKNGTPINVKGIYTGYNKDELGLGADIILNHSCVYNEK